MRPLSRILLRIQKWVSLLLLQSHAVGFLHGRLLKAEVVLVTFTGGLEVQELILTREEMVDFLNFLLPMPSGILEYKGRVLSLVSIFPVALLSAWEAG